MRIYCWKYPSYEDIPENQLKHMISYVGETAEGSILSCGYCKKEFVASAALQECPHCAGNLIFPRPVPDPEYQLMD